METSLNEAPGTIQTPAQTSDYSAILKAYGLEYTVKENYLQVGEPIQVQGWILHVSVVISQVNELLQTLLPALMAAQVPFKMPIDSGSTHLLLSGMLGYTNLGKVVTLYPESDEKASGLAQQLIELTKNFKGPAIPTDAHLGAVVYTRYGGFNPVLKAGVEGRMDKYIYNYAGQLVPDNYNVPFVLPERISWPFTAIKSYNVIPPKKLLHDCIKPITVLKADAKGGVIKGLYVKNLLKAQYCLVKEGKMHMFSDENGRDIQDRLEWQYQLHNELAPHLPLPKIIDYFREGDDLYLATEFIEGVSLGDKICDVYNGDSWVNLPVSRRILLLDYLLSAVDIIQKLHERGYVHRDVNAENFMVDKKNKLYIIDLEITYCVHLNKPAPAFEGGTPGFMSPEQTRKDIPTAKDDIYSIGALMVQIFTCLHPFKFEMTDLSELIADLYFFIPEEEIVTLVSDCLQPEGQQRPDPEIIKAILYTYRNKLSASLNYPVVPPVRDLQEDLLKDVISKALEGMCSSQMTTEEGLWISKTSDVQQGVLNPQMSSTIYQGLFKGLSGVLYMLSRLKQCGVELEPVVEESFQTNLTYLLEHYKPASSKTPSGLSSGSAGVAMMLAAAIERGFAAPTEAHLSFIRTCLDRQADEPDLINGAAGQGIALLHCASFLPEAFVRQKLRALTDWLLQYQHKDGSWLFQDPDGRNMYITGLGQGIAGITCFLLMAGAQLQNNAVLNAATKAVQWFRKKADKMGESYTWPLDSQTRAVNPWVLHGNAGIALVYIRAYEFSKDLVYKKMATAILSRYAFYISSLQLSHVDGLAGLGEVYLEAWRVFKEENWRQRAVQIAGTIIHQKKLFNDGGCYWLADNGDLFPTADLMTGNGGIIHFLAGCLQPNLLRYPLYPNVPVSL